MSRSSQRILVFTDSRGELKKTFADQPIYPERLEAELTARGHEVELMLCPFKWTTTLDFIECIERGFIEPREYDRVVLHTGVVEWSPRNESNFWECLRGSDEPIERSRLTGRGKRPRMANDKLRFLREFIGADEYDRHAASRFDSTYRGEPTINLVSLKMVERVILPYLLDRIGAERLLYINASRIHPDWEGNYRDVNPDGRPPNIGILSDYAQRMVTQLSTVIDLLTWTDDELKTFTVDSMHLTHAGSEWVFRQLMILLHV